MPSAPNFGKYIALPWVNDNSGNIQNEVTSNGDGVFAWGSDTEKLSFMPYLLWLTEQICEAVGFTYDFSEWDQSNWRYLLCCNTVPQAWDILNFAEGLPHWTVDEYFEEIEKLMQCEVTIDYVNRHISLVWSKDVSASAGEIVINNSMLVDDFSAEMKNIVSEDEDYSYSQLYKYADSGDNESDLELCDWLIQDNPKYIKEMTDEEFDTFIETVKGMKVSAKTVFTASSGETINGKKSVTYDLTACNPYNRIVHARDSYFIVVLDEYLEDETKNIQNSLKITYSYYSCRIEKIASFAPFMTEKEEDAATSLNIVPVSLQLTDIGRLPHFDCGELAETVTAEIDSSIHAGDNWRRFSEMIEAGESESDSIFGVIRVGFHKPVLENIFAPSALVPIVDKVMLNGDGIVTIADGEFESLRLCESRKYNDKIKFSQVNCSDKYTYEFISDNIPNVRAVFVIAGKRYLCEKITVTFTPRGMQKKLKGVFYPIGE